MPEDEAEFHQSFPVLKFLEETKKNAYIFTHDFRVSLIPAKYRPRVIEHTVGETNRLNLATHKLIDKIKGQDFQAVIDLNIKDNIFFSHIISSVNVPLRIGFKKSNSDKYYNVQINPEDSRPEISYKNLVNCLHMF
jgi:ADP-heptose:LPS heptosyltransferase